jgi:hypothetical protein
MITGIWKTRPSPGRNHEEGPAPDPGQELHVRPPNEEELEIHREEEVVPEEGAAGED